ncbi:hypothetical protein NPIL_7501 [Nephila pilipes]|uniref:Uncharacterized protein n=1 Tax=Nephila pilipes TaxID=299642 RepID=A0A8X6PCU1_NEPPI|nr:hypothetical protein NPIL_7501 [Nephila pilipes]
MRGAVVLDLISKLPENKQYDLFFDNPFISNVFIDKLTEKEWERLALYGLIELKVVHFKGIKSIKKDRGGFDFQNSKYLKMVRWNNNNSVVTLSSNLYGFVPIAQTKR